MSTPIFWIVLYHQAGQQRLFHISQIEPVTSSLLVGMQRDQILFVPNSLAYPVYGYAGHAVILTMERIYGLFSASHSTLYSTASTRARQEASMIFSLTPTLPK